MIPSFRIGGDTGIESPEAIKRQRAVALALLGQASDTSPTDMYGGIARVGQGVISALMNRRADKSEKRGQDDANQKFNAILGSLMGPQASPSPVGAETVNPTPYEMQGIPDPRSPEFTIKDDRNLPIVGGPGMIHAAPQGQQAPQQPQPQPQGSNFEAAAQEVDALPMAEIMDLMNNPYLTEAQSNILGMVVKSKFDRGEWRSLGDGRIFNSGTGEVQDFGMKQEAPKPPSSVQEYEYAKGQGYQGSFQDWQSMNKGGTEVNVNMPGPIPDANLRKNLDDEQAKVWGEYLRAGSVSGANAQDFAVLDELLKIAPQGPITGRLAEMFPGVSSAGDAVQSIVKRIAPTLRAPGSGATSDIEYEGMLQSLPALRNNPAANQMILQIMRTKADLNVKRAEIISQYQTGDIDAATARRGVAELDKVSILTPQMRSALAGIQGGPGAADSGPAPEGIDPKLWGAMTPEERALWQN